MNKQITNQNKKLKYVLLYQILILSMFLIGCLYGYFMREDLGYMTYIQIFVCCYIISIFTSIFYSFKVASLQLFIAIVPVIAIFVGNILMWLVLSFDLFDMSAVNPENLSQFIKNMNFFMFIDLWNEYYPYWSDLHKTLFFVSYLLVPIVAIPVAIKLIISLYFKPQKR
jgi:hypothetical protein